MANSSKYQLKYWSIQMSSTATQPITEQQRITLVASLCAGLAASGDFTYAIPPADARTTDLAADAHFLTRLFALFARKYSS